MSKTSDTVFAFLLGAVAGGVVALLLAPEKGEVTRGKIRKGATDLYGKGRDLVDRGQREVTEKVGQVGEKARERLQDVTDGARHQLEAVKGAVAEGKEAYRREMEKS